MRDKWIGKGNEDGLGWMANRLPMQKAANKLENATGEKEKWWCEWQKSQVASCADVICDTQQQTLWGKASHTYNLWKCEREEEKKHTHSTKQIITMQYVSSCSSHSLIQLISNATCIFSNGARKPKTIRLCREAIWMLCILIRKQDSII